MIVIESDITDYFLRWPIIFRSYFENVDLSRPYSKSRPYLRVKVKWVLPIHSPEKPMPKTGSILGSWYAWFTRCGGLKGYPFCYRMNFFFLSLLKNQLFQQKSGLKIPELGHNSEKLVVLQYFVTQYCSPWYWLTSVFIISRYLANFENQYCWLWYGIAGSIPQKKELWPNFGFFGTGP